MSFQMQLLRKLRDDLQFQADLPFGTIDNQTAALFGQYASRVNGIMETLAVREEADTLTLQRAVKWNVAFEGGRDHLLKMVRTDTGYRLMRIQPAGFTFIMEEATVPSLVERYLAFNLSDVQNLNIRDSAKVVPIRAADEE